jgi:hypothetical protein
MDMRRGQKRKLAAATSSLVLCHLFAQFPKRFGNLRVSREKISGANIVD